MFSRYRVALISATIFTVVMMNIFRYIFKFGAPSSSPGYSETPVTFWIIRYSLVGLILLLFASSWKRFRLFEWIAFAVLALSSVYAFSLTGSTLIKIAAFHLCLVGLLFSLIRSMEDDVAIGYVNHFTKLLYVLTVSFAAFLVLQVFLYFAFDILPSHSHKNSILIRFGSILDDSLAFGVLLPMFAGLLYYSLKDEFLRSVSLMAIILVAVLTGSLTAMATTAIYTLWLMKFRWQSFLSWGLLIALLIISFHWYFLELWSAKSGSIAGHLEGLQLLSRNLQGLQLPSGNLAAEIQSLGFAESGWILIFVNFGIFALFVLIGFHLYIQFLCARLLRSNFDRKQYVGAVEGLNFSAFLASFNLPVIMIFPVYFLLAIFSAVLCAMASKNGIGLKS